MPQKCGVCDAQDQLFGDNRDHRDNRDNREIYYHSDDTLFRCGLFRLCGLCGLKKNLTKRETPISWEKGLDLALTRKLADGTYMTYFPFASLTEESKMTPYHKKLLFVGIGVSL